MPGDMPDGRSRSRWRGRPLLLTGTAVAAVTVGAGLALARRPARHACLAEAGRGNTNRRNSERQGHCGQPVVHYAKER